MDPQIVELNDAQTEEIEDRLSEYDRRHTAQPLSGQLRLGLTADGRLVADLDVCITALHILYVSMLFVDEAYRRKGLGARLIRGMEARARQMSVTLIRLDTFNWQGRDFYRAIGYEEVGSDQCEAEDFSKHFFLKRLNPKMNAEHGSSCPAFLSPCCRIGHSITARFSRRDSFLP